MRHTARLVIRMDELTALPAFQDNYIWLLHNRTGDAVVVDPGDAGPVIQAIRNGTRIAAIFITHHHPDHVGLAGWFVEQGAELLIPRTAYFMSRMLVLDERPLPGPEQLAFWRAAGMDEDALARRTSERPFNFADCVAPLPLGFTRLSEGDSISFGQQFTRQPFDGI